MLVWFFRGGFFEQASLLIEKDRILRIINPHGTMNVSIDEAGE
jgi:hypothetical protein